MTSRSFPICCAAFRTSGQRAVGNPAKIPKQVASFLNWAVKNPRSTSPISSLSEQPFAIEVLDVKGNRKQCYFPGSRAQKGTEQAFKPTVFAPLEFHNNFFRQGKPVNLDICPDCKRTIVVKLYSRGPPKIDLDNLGGEWALVDNEEADTDNDWVLL
ncbi:hypothetical protein EJ08DRAFT_656355 [Tothia fuscella]|uniref:Uncharacterized protein n=1 Tax=Tothia fuscella TaxID=1048955 RepID=A0A9P4P293_9PEZI|nr:hypothetical protein EJ08DRAFT_656355 [Tothia fuscella]